MVVIVLLIAAVCAFGWIVANCTKTVGKTVKESDFKEFCYTYSSTVNPPEFQRYQIYSDKDKKTFHYQKREGNNTFLTEEDIVLSFELELTTQQWEMFWNYISGGTVKNRKESTVAGGAGVWMYLYWNGDRDKWQVFEFADSKKEAEFVKFCEALKSEQ